MKLAKLVVRASSGQIEGKKTKTHTHLSETQGISIELFCFLFFLPTCRKKPQLNRFLTHSLTRFRTHVCLSHQVAHVRSDPKQSSVGRLGSGWDGSRLQGRQVIVSSCSPSLLYRCTCTGHHNTAGLDNACTCSVVRRLRSIREETSHPRKPAQQFCCAVTVARAGQGKDRDRDSRLASS